jgi:cholesterol transport system auxiliary component
VPVDMMPRPEAQLLTPSRTLSVLAVIGLLSGCAALPAPQVADQNIYVLDAQPATQTALIKRDFVLAISPLQARPGFDTPQMIYTQQPHEVRSFLTNQWADTPARMLEPLLVQAMEQTGSFRAIVQPRGALPADVLLETELIRLWHDFATRPSRVQLTLRARLIDLRGKRVLAVKQFDDTETVASDDAYGGVAAANRATQRVLEQLADFCVNAAVIQ